MTTKAELHRLLDELPDSELAAVERFLKAARDAAAEDPVRWALDHARADDEPPTEEDTAALREAREDFAAGRTISLDEVRRGLGL